MRMYRVHYSYGQESIEEFVLTNGDASSILADITKQAQEKVCVADVVLVATSDRVEGAPLLPLVWAAEPVEEV